MFGSERLDILQKMKAQMDERFVKRLPLLIVKCADYGYIFINVQ